MSYSPMELYWIWLSNVEGIGVKRFYQLLTVFEDPRNVWDNVNAPELRFLGPKTWANLKEARRDEVIDDLLIKMEEAGCRAITRVSDGYPRPLMEIYDPPATLYIRGDCAIDDERMFAIVGSRRCTRDGQRAAAEIAEGLSLNGVTVVSGLARGTDTNAHEGVLKADGRTIAVLGCGVDVIYPPENGDLAARILDLGGALVSEYPPGTQPLQGHFPARNRIISGLCRGTLIVEGAQQSGAMITINCALDQGRDVFAVPGSIYSPLSASPNKLIVDGAMPVLSAWEILEHYRWAERPTSTAKPKASVALDEDEMAIVRPILDQELTLEELRQQTGLPVNKLNARLTILELRGVVVKAPGGMYRAYLPDR